jgi:hypothetical protein
MSEIWRTLKQENKGYTNQLIIEVSNFGRVRSTSSKATKRIIKGTLLEGYPAINLKYFKPVEVEAEAKIKFMRQQINLLLSEIRKLKKEIANTNIADVKYVRLNHKLKSTEELKDRIKTNYDQFYRKVRNRMTTIVARLIHRLVAEAFVPKTNPNQKFVIHLDYNKTNNYYTNLKWVTQIELNKHNALNPAVIADKKKRKGRSTEGSKVYKLTSSQVSLIKKKMNQGELLSKLAVKFGVSHIQLLRIKRGINWSHVPPAK